MIHLLKLYFLLYRVTSRELTSIGVKAVKPTAGYYVFPDFEMLKPALNKRGVHTCQEMCEKLLEEAKVAVSTTQ